MHGVERRIDYGGKIGIVLNLGETKYHTGHTFDLKHCLRQINFSLPCIILEVRLQ